MLITPAAGCLDPASSLGFPKATPPSWPEQLGMGLWHVGVVVFDVQALLFALEREGSDYTFEPDMFGPEVAPQLALYRLAPKWMMGEVKKRVRQILRKHGCIAHDRPSRQWARTPMGEQLLVELAATRGKDGSLPSHV